MNIEVNEMGSNSTRDVLPETEKSQVAPCSSAGQHSPECPLSDYYNTILLTMIKAFVYEGWRHPSAQTMMDAVAECTMCCQLFRQMHRDMRMEEYERALRLVHRLADLQESTEAAKQGKVWRTRDIEQSLLGVSTLRSHMDEDDILRVFHAFVSLMRESMDTFSPDVPYVRFHNGLLPNRCRESHALEYMASRADIDIRSLSLVMAEIEEQVRAHTDKALQPLGWFMTDEDDCFWLIGWKSRPVPQHTVMETQQHKEQKQQENEHHVSNILKPEDSNIVRRLQEVSFDRRKKIKTISCD